MFCTRVKTQLRKGFCVLQGKRFTEIVSAFDDMIRPTGNMSAIFAPVVDGNFLTGTSREAEIMVREEPGKMLNNGDFLSVRTLRMYILKAHFHVRTFCQVRSEKVRMRTIGSQQFQVELCVKKFANHKNTRKYGFHPNFFDKKYARVYGPLHNFVIRKWLLCDRR
jgi:hypothetical protein